jgi:short-subunit dehydrogenase
MRQQRSGRIINVSSVLGFLPVPYMGLYSASKHAIEGMSETLDHEVRNFGVRVVLVEPSFTKTNLDLNAPQAANRISAYDGDRDLVSKGHRAKRPEGSGVGQRRRRHRRRRIRQLEDASYTQRRGLPP